MSFLNESQKMYGISSYSHFEVTVTKEPTRSFQKLTDISSYSHFEVTETREPTRSFSKINRYL